MCKRNVSKRTFACGHQLDSLGDLVPDGGCKGCGIEKGRNHGIASSVIPLPCDDCKVAGLWVQKKNGKVRVSLLKCHPDINFSVNSPWMWVFAFKLIVFQNTPSATLTTFKRWNILWDEALTNPPLLAALPPVIKYSASYTYACIYRASWICRVGVSYLKSLVEPSQLIVTAQSQTEKVTTAKSSVVLTGIAQLTIPISHRKWCNSFDWRCIMRSNPRVSTNGPEFAMLSRSRGALASC